MLRDVSDFDPESFAFGHGAEHAATNAVDVQAGPSGATATIADAHLLFNSDFVRAGHNLILRGHDGGSAVVRDYFASDTRATLISRDGAKLSGELIDMMSGPLAPGQYAQAGAPAQAASDAVGRVVTGSGDASIIRNGVAVTLKAGDPVLRADVLQTQAGTMAVTFNDGSTLNLTANTRIVVSEFVYSPNGAGNSQLLNLVQGSLTFISGEVAHSGNMRIGTPVATMGIRGTVGGVTTANDGTVHFYVSQSATGAVIINEQGQIIANVVQDGPMIVVRPAGPLQVIAEEIQKSPQQLAVELQALQQIVSIKAVGDQLLQQFFQQQNPNNPNPQTPQNGPHTQIQIDLHKSPGNAIGDDLPGGNPGPIDQATIHFVPTNPDNPAIPTTITDLLQVNLPPVTFAPLSLTTAEDTPLIFGGPRAITIVDNDSSILTVTLSVTNGVLSLGNVSQLSFSSGDGANDGTMTFSGSPAAIAAALNGLTYTPSQDYNGAAVLSVTKTDGHSAPTTTSVALNITPVNDAPVIVGSVAADLPLIAAAGPGGGLEPEAGLNAQIAGNGAVQAALSGLLTVPAGVITVALATVRSELHIDTATAMTVVWDYLDDIYVSAGPHQTNVNEAFTRLGIEYAKYLKNGGAPLTNITAKYTPDGADAGTAPDRVQSLHDNLLGNLGSAALLQRYGGNPALLAELTALINGVDPALLTRPYYSGNEGSSPAAVQAWDAAHGYTPAATGMLVATDVDHNATLTWSVTQPAGTYGTFAVDAVSGVWTYKLDHNLPATQALAQGETATETFTAKVTDEHGASDTIVVTVTATGSNDAPVIVGSVAADLPLIAAAGPGGGLEPEAGLNAQIAGNGAVQAALSGLLTVPAGVITVALATVRSELHIDTATAMTVVWDYLDDIYVSAGPHQTNVNEAFTRLGIEYAKYLKNGGAPLTNITAKYTPDGADAGTAPDRVQSLHDNLLGNLGSAALLQRYGGNPALLAELTALINGVDPALLTRPYYSGNEGSSPAAVQAWDAAHGYTPAATGMLVATDVDHNATLTWSVTQPAGTYGTFAVDAVSGVWTYKLDHNLPATQALAQGETATETFTAKVTDEHGASDTIVVTVTATGSNDAPVVTPASATVSEEGLGGGLPDTTGTGDTTNSAVAHGTISATDVDHDTLTYKLGLPDADLTSNNVPITWTLCEDGTLKGSAGGNQVISVALDPHTGAYTVTLTGPIDHPNTGAEDELSFNIPVVVDDGTVTTNGSQTVTVEDDSPKAADITATTSANPQNSTVNIVIILDTSGSMDGERLSLAKAAIANLLSTTNVTINSVMAASFSSDGSVHSGDNGPWVSAEEANDYFQGVSTAGGTNYSGAITGVMAAWGANAPSAADKTLVYFISDGEPSPGEGLDANQTAAWETFLSQHGVATSYAIGISTGVDDQDLAPIAWSATDVNFLPIVLDSATGLDGTLQGTVVTTHNIFTDSNATVGFGADGGHIESVTVDGVTYTWNGQTGGGAAIHASGEQGQTTYGTSLSMATALGGVFTFYFASDGSHAAGDWTYTPPANVSGSADEVFHYVLVDNDGDHSGANITVAVIGDGYAPVVDLNGASSGANYVANVFNDNHAVAVFGATPSIVDVDNQFLQSASISATLAGHQYYETYGADHMTVNIQALSGASGNGFSGTWQGLTWETMNGSNGLFLNVTGEGSLSTYEQLIAAVRFTTNSDNGADRVFQLTVNDGGHDSAPVTSTVSVHIDEAPVFNTASLAAASDAIHALVTGLAVIDGDAGTDPMSFSMTAQDGTLSFFGTTNGVTVGGSGTGTLTGAGTLTAINTALTNGLLYTSTNPQPPVSSALATIDDGHGKTDTVNFVFANGTVTGPVTLAGTGGKDVVFSAGTDATLTGNGGADTFVFAADNGGTAHITDFGVLDDFLQISHTIFATADAVLASAHDGGNGSTVISTAAQGSLVLDGVDSTTFQSIDHSHIIIV